MQTNQAESRGVSIKCRAMQEISDLLVWKWEGQDVLRAEFAA